MTHVKQLIDLSYRLVNPGNPTTPLRDSDFQVGLYLLNQLLESYASDGLMLTIASTQTLPIFLGKREITVGPPSIPPAPNIYDINVGRMANWESAWVSLDGVDYPLIFKDLDEWHSSFKFNPLLGLPRFIIPFPNVQFVTFRLYPGPSQMFNFHIRGKFQLATYASTDDTVATLPGYYNRYLLFALAKDIAMFKGRVGAWTPILEEELIKATNNIEANSEVNLAIVGDEESLLNGSWRVRSGV